MKRAVILAGGKGTRLRPYTLALPKPLMPVGDYPILEIIVRQLRQNGFDHITLAVNHQADLFKAFFGNGEKWGLTIDYSLEHMPLSTMGPLKLIPDLPDNFLVMNGDILTDIDYGAFLDAHAQSRSLFSISAAKREQRIDYGVLHTNDDMRLVGFEEKPTFPFLVSMGVYAVSNRVLEVIPENQAFGFDHLVLGYLRDDKPVRVVPHEGYWLDIGRPDDYQQAQDDWQTLSAKLALA
ncbi:sugar phosphate nucleotidyltransferase [Lysobacter gummosus]|jgi:NDP-sugar pyrophosphorylase family protein|uniref:NTP transferase domain-containing protein n=1 Tax=Lysobacter gummosus TaxID=262324 RepID=A0ABY3XD78_9GAMM|nr:sugar phosphate nucleotidyltransferase [Lysobacter gummosus]ALN93116.1 mobA-like NTP transferase domain protein [Lysobacter gummosus]UNP28625.1 NTP transferase domain-containing protein [Lysobacter gummosus]